MFAGGVGESGKAGGGYQERVKQAVDLYRAGYAPHMIFSSGFVFAFQEAEVMRALAVDNGVPASAIVLETRAAQHATRTSSFSQRDPRAARMAPRAARQLAVSHATRAVLTWHKLAPDMSRWSQRRCRRASSTRTTRGASLEQIRGIAQEYAAIVVYWWRGWI